MKKVLLVLSVAVLATACSDDKKKSSVNVKANDSVSCKANLTVISTTEDGAVASGNRNGYVTVSADAKQLYSRSKIEIFDMAGKLLDSQAEESSSAEGDSKKVAIAMTFDLIEGKYTSGSVSVSIAKNEAESEKLNKKVYQGNSVELMAMAKNTMDVPSAESDSKVCAVEDVQTTFTFNEDFTEVHSVTVRKSTTSANPEFLKLMEQVKNEAKEEEASK